MAWPEKLMRGRPRDFSLDYLYMMREASRKDPDGREAMIYPGQKMLMGHVLPPFQRPHVWSREQSIKFIESAVLGLHLGTWCFNSADHEKNVDVDGAEYFNKTHMWLIDGQQRFTAIDEFFSDKFPVFGQTWSEVSKPVQRRFLNSTMFVAFETRIIDINHLKELYNRLAFGGVAHTPDQRAVVGDEDESAVTPTALVMR